MRKIIWLVYAPNKNNSIVVAAFTKRRDAKKYITKLNQDIPSWHYNELYKIGAITVIF